MQKVTDERVKVKIHHQYQYQYQYKYQNSISFSIGMILAKKKHLDQMLEKMY